MSEREDLIRDVRAAVEGTPYVVTDTDSGFEVTLDIVDAKWFGLYFKEGLHRVHTQHVAVPGNGTYSITDDSRTVEWQAGVPTISGSVQRSRGRVVELSSEKIWALGEDLHLGRVVDYQFDSREGRSRVRAAAGNLGLKLQRGGAEKIGLYAALLGGAGALLALVALAVQALL